MACSMPKIRVLIHTGSSVFSRFLVCVRIWIAVGLVVAIGSAIRMNDHWRLGWHVVWIWLACRWCLRGRHSFACLRLKCWYRHGVDHCKSKSLLLYCGRLLSVLFLGQSKQQIRHYWLDKRLENAPQISCLRPQSTWIFNCTQYSLVNNNFS